jgi:hypothetical protein
MDRNDLFLASTRPNYYELLPRIEAAMAEEDRICAARMDAGWDFDPEYGWGTPDGITESDWTFKHGYPLPEDSDFAEFIKTYSPVR